MLIDYELLKMLQMFMSDPSLQNVYDGCITAVFTVTEKYVHGEFASRVTYMIVEFFYFREIRLVVIQNCLSYHRCNFLFKILLFYDILYIYLYFRPKLVRW